MIKMLYDGWNEKQICEEVNKFMNESSYFDKNLTAKATKFLYPEIAKISQGKIASMKFEKWLFGREAIKYLRANYANIDKFSEKELADQLEKLGIATQFLTKKQIHNKFKALVKKQIKDNLTAIHYSINKLVVMYLASQAFNDLPWKQLDFYLKTDIKTKDLIAGNFADDSPEIRFNVLPKLYRIIEVNNLVQDVIKNNTALEILEPVADLTDFNSRIERINEDYFEGKDLLKDFYEEKNLDKQSEYLVFFFTDNRKGNYINKLRRITEKLAN